MDKKEHYLLAPSSNLKIKRKLDINELKSVLGQSLEEFSRQEALEMLITEFQIKINYLAGAKLNQHFNKHPFQAEFSKKSKDESITSKWSEKIFASPDLKTQLKNNLSVIQNIEQDNCSVNLKDLEERWQNVLKIIRDNNDDNVLSKENKSVSFWKKLLLKEIKKHNRETNNDFSQYSLYLSCAGDIKILSFKPNLVFGLISCGYNPFMSHLPSAIELTRHQSMSAPYLTQLISLGLNVDWFIALSGPSYYKEKILDHPISKAFKAVCDSSEDNQQSCSELYPIIVRNSELLQNSKFRKDLYKAMSEHLEYEYQHGLKQFKQSIELLVEKNSLEKSIKDSKKSNHIHKI